MDEESITLLKQFEQELETDVDEEELEPQEETVDWKKLRDELKMKNQEYVEIIEKQMRTIKYMGETVMKMGFTFDEINSMFTSN
jgi:CRISPR/Cas system-associated endonuclease Cas3-HD